MLNAIDSGSVTLALSRRSARRRMLATASFVSFAAVGLSSGVSAHAQAIAEPDPAAAPTAPATEPENSTEAPAETEADTQPQTISAANDIIVSGTRVVRDGYNAPTPVTVIGAEQVNSAAEPTIFNVVNQLPALAGSASTRTGNTGSSSGTGGLSALGLRGLGTNRTLVMIDNQRIIGASLTGVVDVSELPQQLISRVDVVTGGASAGWGSDAVAGVVNFITDKNFTGVKGDISHGITTYGDDYQYRVALTVGANFLDDRAHFVISGEYAHQDGIQGTNRPWYRGTKVLMRSLAGTPAGQPQYIVADKVAHIQLYPGGIITAGPLAGTAFGPGGVPFQFQYGNPIITPFMIGGDQAADIGNRSNIENVLARKTLYARLSYDLSDSINLWIAGNYGQVRTHYDAANVYRTANITIRNDNAFLAPSIAAAMADAGVTSFQMGSSNEDIGPFQVSNTRTMKRFTAGLDGSTKLLGTEWKWNSYIEIASNHIYNHNPNEVINPLYNQAIDAVRDTSGNIVCRSTLTNPSDGCVPLNVMGLGVASQGALDYIIGEPYLITTQKQTAASLSFSGEPFNSWAGPVSIAFGGEYRKESFHSVADPISEGDAGNPLFSPQGNNWFTGNFHGSSGSFNVYEGFLEAVVPLLNSEKIGTADLNAAARATQYSTAGYVTTWKVGLTYSPIPDIRLRGTISRDIRAPNLNELFSAATVQTQTVVDAFPPYAGQTFTIQRPLVGNTALKPEIANSWEAGVVFQPEFLPGFHASFDFYRIKINDVISTLSNQQTMDLCFQGNQDLCSLIERNELGQPTKLTVQAINLASQVNKGFDIEADYTFRLFAGSLNMRALLTRTIVNSTDSGIPNAPILDLAGQNSGSTPFWRGLFMQTYSSDDSKFDLTFTERWISAGNLNNQWIECTSDCPLPTINNPTVDNNHVAGALYLDIAAGYKFSTEKTGFRPEFYFKVNNVLNKAPARVAASGSLAMIASGVNATLYDTLGRTFRAGFRFTF